MTLQEYLNIGTFNVCGLLNKWSLPELQTVLNQFDILCINKTKLTPIDASLIDLAGYNFIYSNRKSFQRRSGGVGIFIKQNLFPTTTKITVKGKLADTCIPVILSNPQLNENLLCISIYIPPEGSKYSFLEMFDDLEELILAIRNEHMVEKIILLGDLNARTGLTNDSIKFSRHLQQDCGTEPLELRPRANQDRFVNAYGKRLVQLCTTMEMRIMNGRVEGDLMGKPTSNDSSTIDYIVVSEEAVPCIQSMKVHNFDPLLSDMHCLISVKCQINLLLPPGSSTDIATNEKRFITKWNPQNNIIFKSNFDDEDLEQLLQDLQNYDFNKDTIDVDCLVNDSNRKIIDFFMKAAGNCDMTKVCNNTRSHKNIKKQPWYNLSCREARKEYHRKKNLFRRYPNEIYKNQLKNASRLYKNTMSVAKSEHRRRVAENLEGLSSNNPEDFWNILHRETRSKTPSPAQPAASEFYDHFSNLLDMPHESKYRNIKSEKIASNNFFLNQDITVDHVKKGINNLKSGKSPGLDNVLNEFLKNAPEKMIVIITKFFNIIFKTAVIPEDWNIACIVPIYKNKGSRKDTNNYRGISLLSCLGKLFTSILNKRLSKYLEDYDVLNMDQAGFRPGHSTTGHIFSLRTLINIYLSKKQSLYCTFIDLQKAFDTINREALWLKLLGSNIDGNFLRVITNIYNKTKSVVRCNNEISSFFTSQVGVRQGDNLSPILFLLYLNDLSAFLAGTCRGLSYVSDISHQYFDDDEIAVYFKLFLLLYADDSVIFAESVTEMQSCLDAICTYCNIWSLTVNTNKTKVVVFSNSRRQQEFRFFYNGNILEVLKEFVYLGVVFTSNGRFNANTDALVLRAEKALFGLQQKIRMLNLSPKVALKLFDSTVLSVLLYGCEAWGDTNISKLESFHLKFCKDILKLRKSTANAMVYGECGRYPIDIVVKKRCISFWHKLLTTKTHHLSGILFNLARTMNRCNQLKYPWLDFVKNILIECGIPYVFEYPGSVKTTWLAQFVESTLKDLFITNWNQEIITRSSCVNYRIFKSSLCFESYLTQLSPHLRSYLCKFRCGNFRLPIVLHRFNPDISKYCTLCDTHSIGDEFHYLLECKAFTDMRRIYIPPFFVKYTNTLKFSEIMLSSGDKLLALAKFCKIIISKLNASTN